MGWKQGYGFKRVSLGYRIHVDVHSIDYGCSGSLRYGILCCDSDSLQGNQVLLQDEIMDVSVEGCFYRNVQVFIAHADKMQGVLSGRYGQSEISVHVRGCPYTAVRGKDYSGCEYRVAFRGYDAAGEGVLRRAYIWGAGQYCRYYDEGGCFHGLHFPVCSLKELSIKLAGYALRPSEQYFPAMSVRPCFRYSLTRYS